MSRVVRAGRTETTRRFGPVPAWAEQQIDAAPVTQLDAWLDGIFDAASLEDLIGDAAG